MVVMATANHHMMMLTSNSLMINTMMIRMIVMVVRMLMKGRGWTKLRKMGAAKGTWPTQVKPHSSMNNYEHVNVLEGP